jgi:hypothetical protein
MSESANIPSTVSGTPTTSACQSAPCSNTQKPAQPQPASAPTPPPVTNKGFRRQPRKQH